MSPRLPLVLTASIALASLAACSAPAAQRPADGTGAVASPAIVPVATPTRIPVPPTAPPDAEPSPDIGDVEQVPGTPELSVEAVGADAIQASIDDPAAHAWRITVAGTGELAADRWEIAVEAGDVGPLITATEVVDGAVVDTMDLSGFGDGTAAAGGCHSVLPVCLDSTGFRLPQDGDGHFSVRLVLPDKGTPLMVSGATASWPDEPFVLGPWHETEAFPWGAQG